MRLSLFHAGWSLITLLGLVSITFSEPSQAGDKIGNGGAIWACDDKAGDFQSGLLLDLFEARTEFGLPVMSTAVTDPFQIAADLMAQWLREWPELIDHVKPHMDAVLQNKRFVDAVVEKIDDAEPPISPLKSLCKGTWDYVQIANYKDDGQLLIRKDLWESGGLASLDKAALLWHEAIYRWLRTDYQDQTSTRSRHIVGLLFSTLPVAQISLEVRKVLWGTLTPNPAPAPTPAPPPAPLRGFICLMDENLQGSVYMSTADTELDARTLVELRCKNGPQGHFCVETSLECEARASGEMFQCKAKNGVTGHLYLGRAESLLEAKYNAQMACSNADPQWARNCTPRSMMDCVRQ